jgi:hypothetical protein
MSQSSASGQATPGARRAVASFSSYRDAQQAVDRLSDAGFPVERVAIVGSGLRYVEQIGGRLTTGRATLNGAGQGALIGLLFALLFGIFFTGPDFLGLLVYGIVAGALFGALFGLLMHTATGGQRDFTSVARTEADRYEVMVDEEVAGEAERLLQGGPASADR